MSDWMSLATGPVSQENPAGTDPRYVPEYDILQGEIHKLAAITGGSPDWRLVTDSAAVILRDKGKDIPAAVYFSIGLGKTAALAGWTEGTRVLTAIMTHWWDQAFPPLKRMKGRINALEWWREQSLSLLNEWAVLPPQAAGNVENATRAVSGLDTLLGELLPDMPPLRSILDALRELPVQSPAPAAVSPASSAGPDAGDPAAGGDSSAAGAGSLQAAAPAGTSSAPVSAASTTPQKAAASATSPVFSPDLTPPALAADADAASALTALQNFSGSVLTLLTAETGLPAAPALWQVVYAALLGHILALPPAENGRTAIPAPDSSVLVNVEKLLGGGNAAGAARAALNFLPQSPLWFSLHFVLFKALRSAGGEYAATARTVYACCRLCAADLEGVTELAYEDGTPFASETARKWLAGGEGGGTAPDPVSSLTAQAQILLREGRPSAALEMLEARQDRRGRIRCRLAQMDLLRAQQQWAVALGIAHGLLEEMEYFHLEEWEPALAFSIWAEIYRVRLGSGMEDGATGALHRAAALDPAGALRLVS